MVSPGRNTPSDWLDPETDWLDELDSDELLSELELLKLLVLDSEEALLWLDSELELSELSDEVLLELVLLSLDALDAELSLEVLLRLDDDETLDDSEDRELPLDSEELVLLSLDAELSLLSLEAED